MWITTTFQKLNALILENYKKLPGKSVSIINYICIFITRRKIGKLSGIFELVIFVDTTSFQKLNTLILENYRKLPGKSVSIINYICIFITRRKIGKLSGIFELVIFVDTTSFQKLNTLILENYRKLPGKSVSIINHLCRSRTW